MNITLATSLPRDKPSLVMWHTVHIVTECHSPANLSRKRNDAAPLARIALLSQTKRILASGSTRSKS